MKLVSEADCVAGGGFWLRQITEKNECKNGATRCEETTSHFCPFKVDGTQGSLDFRTNKTSSDCTACGGKNVIYFFFYLYEELIFLFNQF